MKRLWRVLAVMATFVLLMAAPASPTAVSRPIRSATLGSAAAVVPVGASPTCKPAARVVCVTASAGGKVTSAHIGDKVEVVLDRSGLIYNGLREGAPVILRLESGPSDKAGVVRATFLAVRTGETALLASAGPRCVADEACPDFVMLFTARVRVVR